VPRWYAEYSATMNLDLAPAYDDLTLLRWRAGRCKENAEKSSRQRSQAPDLSAFSLKRRPPLPNPPLTGALGVLAHARGATAVARPVRVAL
jgi:hypothetical protein